MPNSDPQIRREQNEAWKKRRYRDPYMKWLYGRRKLPKEQNEVYLIALRRIAEETLDMTARDVALGAIDWAEQKERSLGNKFDHDNERGYWKE